MDLINLCIGNLLPYGSGSNAILIVIGMCSLISFSIMIERLIFLKNADADTNLLLLSLRKHIEDNNLLEAIKTCETTGGSIARVLKAGLMKHSRPQEHLESSLEIAGMIEVAALERNAKILSVIAHIAPLIGLLGTVIGFIQAFSEMKMSGLVDISANQIGEAMEYALITTAAGLVVAIPSVIGYNYLVSRVEGFVLEMQTTCSEIVDLLVHRDNYL
jgi:biopolymer transport protein ExbB